MKVVALEGQSFFDLAVQGGTVESIFGIDPNISITDDPAIGQEYSVAVNNIQISNYYQRNKIEPATTLTEEDISISTPDDGIGAMSIENTFIVR